jgi:uroporphyrinogen decarboxylase
MSLSPRERVMLAVNHREPDRLPLALWGSWYGVTDRLYLQVLEELGWQPVPPFRPELLHSVNYYDDRLLELLNVDVRHVDPGVTAVTSRLDGEGKDAWGLRWDNRGAGRTVSYHPLAAATIEDIHEFRLPDADEVVREEAILARLKTIRAMGQEYAVIGRAVVSYGFLEMAEALRGHEQLLMELALAPEVVQALVNRLYDCYAAMIGRFLDIAGKNLDMIELPGDDFAGNEQPIISPAMFDQFFRQPYQNLISLIKSHSPHVKVIFHSDGAVTPFLRRWVEMGADVLHPLEPLPATDFAAVKAEYGQQLAFLGAIDIREALRGDGERVAEEVKLRIRQLAPGGGYILAPANHLQWDIPPRNLFALYQAGQEYGQYPLNG